MSRTIALTTMVDLQVWVEMVKFARRLGTTSPLKDMISEYMQRSSTLMLKTFLESQGAQPWTRDSD